MTVVLLVILMLSGLVCAAETKDTSVLVDVSNNLVYQAISDSKIGYNVPLGVPHLTGGDYNSPNLVKAMKKLPVTALRYPGGTVANFFEWNAETLDPDVIRKSRHKKMQHLIEKDFSRNKALTHVDLDSFIKVTTDMGAKPFVVLNLYSSSINEIKKSIDKVKSKYKNSVFWELGNELSFKAYQSKYKNAHGWGAKVYKKIASQVSVFINNKYPEDFIGINISEAASYRQPTPGNLKGVERERFLWDNDISEIAHYDAIIVHPYVYLNRKIISQLNDVKLDDDPVLSGIDNNEKIWRWLFVSAEYLPVYYMDRIKKRFPGKKIWITETGITGDRDVLHNSGAMYRLLFNASYYISWMRYQQDIVTYLYHGLFIGNSNNAVLYKDYSYTANGLAFKLIDAAFKGADSVAVPEVIAESDYLGTMNNTTYIVNAISVLHTKSDAYKRTLIVNTGSKPIEIKRPFKVTCAVEYGGDPTMNIKNSKIYDLDDLPRLDITKDAIILKPYSISLLESSLINHKISHPAKCSWSS
ncbi:MAG: hypothetical protein QM500_01930 [Methylococcales bacterium]